MATIGIDASRANMHLRTGTEWYSFEIIKEMQKIDSKNQFFLYTRSPLLDDLKPLGENFHDRYLAWPPKFLWTQFRLSAHMLTHKPDVLFVPAHTIPLIHPRHTIMTLHDVGFERFPELYSKKELAYHRWATRFALRHAEKIIAISQFTKDEIIALYDADPDRIVVIHHGFTAPTTTSVTPKSVLRKFKIDKPFFYYIGRLEKKKNTDGLLRAYEIFRETSGEEVALVLTGFIGEYSGEICDSLRTHKYRDDVFITGYIASEEKMALLQSCEAFVFPSHYEGFGLPALEAMSAGVPVVAARAGALPEICGDAALYVDPRDDRDLSNALAVMAKDRAQRQALLTKGREQCAKFSWESCARATHRLLLNVL